MIIHCLSFGTLWWDRVNPASRGATSASVLYNTTGFRRGLTRTVRYHRHPGIVRFNVLPLIFNQQLDRAKLIQRKFETPGLELYRGTNRLLIERPVAATTAVDKYLVTLNMTDFGTINYEGKWRTKGVSIVASSGTKKGEQETMVLMSVDALIETDLGVWGIGFGKGAVPFLELTNFPAIAGLGKNRFADRVAQSNPPQLGDDDARACDAP